MVYFGAEYAQHPNSTLCKEVRTLQPRVPITLGPSHYTTQYILRLRFFLSWPAGFFFRSIAPGQNPTLWPQQNREIASYIWSSLKMRSINTHFCPGAAPASPC